MSEREVIVLSEGVRVSIAKDVSTFGMIALLISLGVYLDSAAMQWMGFICSFVGIIGLERRYVADNTRTPQAAADFLRDKYGVVAERKSA